MQWRFYSICWILTLKKLVYQYEPSFFSKLRKFFTVRASPLCKIYCSKLEPVSSAERTNIRAVRLFMKRRCCAFGQQVHLLCLISGQENIAPPPRNEHS